MLTTLRNSAQSWLIKLLLGLIVITFVISFGIGTFSNPKEVLVSVGGHEIMVAQYLHRYQEEMDRLRRQVGDNAEALANQLNLREQVMNGMINRYLLMQAAERQGLRVTDEEVRQAVTSNKIFQRNGRFDFETYRQILSQNNMTPTEYEDRLRQDLLLQRQQRNLTAGVIVTDAEVEQRYRVENQRVAVDYIFVNPDRFKLPAAPSKEEQQAYYDQHKDRFTQPEQFKLNYFVLTLADLQNDAEVSDRAVERYYERNAETEFTTPKRVRASHILKRLPKDATPAQVAKAQKEMQGLLARARAGEDFAKLAKENSEDLTKDKGGDLGFFRKDEMVPAFSDAAFALQPGEISDIVRTPFGLHIIKVTEVQPAVRKPLEEVRKQIHDELVRQRAERKLELELQRLPGQIAREGLEAAAKQFGITVQSTDFFDGGTVLPALGSMAPVYSQVQSKAVGDVGVWQRNPVQGHVFYKVEDKKDAFVKPFESVQPEVAKLAAAEQRREMALTEAKRVYGELKSPKDFAAFAKRKGFAIKKADFTAVDSNIEGIGINRDFQRAAFRLSSEEPFALSIKDNQAFLLHFRRRFFAEPDKAKEHKREIATRMEQAQQQYVLQSAIDRLRSQVEVEVQAPEYLIAGGSNAPTRAAY